MIRTAVALALFTAYFAGWVFGAFDLDRSAVPSWPREVFYGLTIGVPSLLAGAFVGRWWAVMVGLVFVAMVPVPERCGERVAVEFDVILVRCHGFGADELPLMLAMTTPCVVAGVAAAKLWRRLRGTGATPRAAAV